MSIIKLDLALQIAYEKDLELLKILIPVNCWIGIKFKWASNVLWMVNNFYVKFVAIMPESYHIILQELGVQMQFPMHRLPWMQ